MSLLEDVILIRKFVQGGVSLLSNSNLQIETNSGISQLLSKNKKLIAIIKLVDKTRSALVRHNSEYGDLLNQILLENSFIPLGITEKEGIMTYEQYEIPEGYDIQHTEAIALWKAWYPYKRYPEKAINKKDIIILVNRKWVKAQEIDLYEGTLFINPSVDKLILLCNDKVVWLTKTNQSTTEAIGVSNQYSRERHIQKQSQILPERSNLRVLSTRPNCEEETLIIANQPKPVSINQNPERAIQSNSTHLESKLAYLTPTNVSKEIYNDAPINLGLNNVLTFCCKVSKNSANSQEQSVSVTDVIRFDRGRLYIKTTIGEIMVEGSDYLFHINPKA